MKEYYGLANNLLELLENNRGNIELEKKIVILSSILASEEVSEEIKRGSANEANFILALADSNGIKKGKR